MANSDIVTNHLVSVVLVNVLLVSAPTCIFLFFYLMFTRYWLISVLYAVWWYFDYDTPARGGNRSPFLCSLKVWEYMRDYFPIKVRESFRLCFCVIYFLCRHIASIRRQKINMWRIRLCKRVGHQNICQVI